MAARADRARPDVRPVAVAWAADQIDVFGLETDKDAERFALLPDGPTGTTRYGTPRPRNGAFITIHYRISSGR